MVKKPSLKVGSLFLIICILRCMLKRRACGGGNKSVKFFHLGNNKETLSFAYYWEEIRLTSKEAAVEYMVLHEGGAPAEKGLMISPVTGGFRTWPAFEPNPVLGLPRFQLHNLAVEPEKCFLRLFSPFQRGWKDAAGFISASSKGFLAHASSWIQERALYSYTPVILKSLRAHLLLL